MATQGLTRITRTVKKLEKPRPLKIPVSQNRNSLVDGRINCVGDIMTLAEEVSTYICNTEYETNLHLSIINLCNNLKAYGQQLEAVYKDQLDRVFVTFRNGSRDENLDYISRIHLLEMIELRARNWLVNEELNNYYRSKLVGIDFEHLPLPETPTLMSVSPPILGSSMAPMTLQPTLLGPGEIIKTSGKFPKPTKIPGKNYWKDEVVIRNSDSGKVMGIKGRRVHMIEELSETIISFQRVNTGAKERLVQITGPAEEKINYAKQLIEDTIRRNASPVRLETIEKDRIGGSSSSLNSSASDESSRNNKGIARSKLLHSFSTNDATSEYKYTVNVGNHTIKITGANLDLVWQAKLVLDEYFSEETERLTSFGLKECDDADSDCPVTNSQPLVSSRVDGVDSGTTSESEETYKAPVATDSAGKQTILRQPSNMDIRSEILQNTESTQTHCVELSHRDSNAQPFYKYTHKELLQFALSEVVKRPPPNWEIIKKEFRGVVRKTAEILDPVIYLQKWQEVDVTNLVVSASEMDLMDAES